jgi:hypothetical protein
MCIRIESPLEQHSRRTAQYAHKHTHSNTQSTYRVTAAASDPQHSNDAGTQSPVGHEGLIGGPESGHVLDVAKAEKGSASVGQLVGFTGSDEWLLWTTRCVAVVVGRCHGQCAGCRRSAGSGTNDKARSGGDRQQ